MVPSKAIETWCNEPLSQTSYLNVRMKTWSQRFYISLFIFLGILSSRIRDSAILLNLHVTKIRAISQFKKS